MAARKEGRVTKWAVKSVDGYTSGLWLQPGGEWPGGGWGSIGNALLYDTKKQAARDLKIHGLKDAECRRVWVTTITWVREAPVARRKHP